MEPSNRSSLVFLAVVVLGLSAGAMLTEAAVFVPYWRSLAPQEFLAWFRANEPRLVAFYGPLQGVSALLVLIAAGRSAYRGTPGTAWLVTSALLVLIVLGMFFAYFAGVNARFVAGTIPVGAVPDELARWATWQWARTAVGTSAFVAAFLAVRSAHSPGR